MVFNMAYLLKKAATLTTIILFDIFCNDCVNFWDMTGDEGKLKGKKKKTNL